MHRARFLALVLVVALIPMVPAAVGQAGPLRTGLTVELEAIDGPLDPEGGRVVVRGMVSMETEVPSMTPIRVVLSLGQVPGWATATLDLTEVMLTTTPIEPRVARAFTATLNIHPNAPAFRPSALRVEAESEATPAFRAGNHGMEIPVQVGYRGELLVESPVARITLARDGVANVPFRVTNLGNADTKVIVTMVPVAAPLAIAIPQPVILSAVNEANKGAVQVIPVPIIAQGRLDGPAHITLRFTPTYALDTRMVGHVFEVMLIVEPGERSSFREAFTSRSGESAQAQMGGFSQAADDPRSGSGFTNAEPDLSVQTAPKSGSGTFPNLRPILPFLGALLGGAAGFAYARKRLLG